MADFNVRSDAVNVEQLMEQIRARIREKRGVDYTEEQIHEMAHVKLEKFLDPRGVRSDLLEQFRRSRPPYSPPDLPNYAFEDHTLFESHRTPLRLIRKLLNPILKMFFNPNPLIQALNIQAKLNTMYAEREARNESARHTFDSLHYEVLHNLVVETTRLGIEVKNLKMKVESLTSRLEFNERRARALESVVVYKPAEGTGHAAAENRPQQQREPRDRGERRETPREVRPARDLRDPGGEPRHDEQATPSSASTPPGNVPVPVEGPGQRSRRRRRRRGRRGSGSAAAIMGESGQETPASEDQATAFGNGDRPSSTDPDGSDEGTGFDDGAPDPSDEAQ